jgi:hypothetical protein
VLSVAQLPLRTGRERSDLAQLSNDGCDDGLHRPVHPHHPHGFAGGGLLEVAELTVQQFGGEEVPVPSSQAGVQEFPGTLQVHHAHARPAGEQLVPVGPFESGTRHHHGAARGNVLVQPSCDRTQPRPPLLVGQGRAGRHLRPVRRGMEVVRLLEGPAEAVGEHASHGGLSRSRHADEEHHERWRIGIGHRSALHLRVTPFCS